MSNASLDDRSIMSNWVEHEECSGGMTGKSRFLPRTMMIADPFLRLGEGPVAVLTSCLLFFLEMNININVATVLFTRTSFLM